MSDFNEPTPPGYKLRALEARADATDERLEKGAEAFAEQRAKFSKAAWALFVTVVVAALAIGRVLQRIDDTAVTQEDHEAQLETVSEQISETKVEQVRLRSAVERVEEGQDRLEFKLDKALEPKRRGR